MTSAPYASYSSRVPINSYTIPAIIERFLPQKLTRQFHLLMIRGFQKGFLQFESCYEFTGTDSREAGMKLLKKELKLITRLYTTCTLELMLHGSDEKPSTTVFPRVHPSQISEETNLQYVYRKEGYHNSNPKSII